MFEFGSDLRQTLTANLANHHVAVIPADDRRRAAVAIVVVDSVRGSEDSHDYFTEEDMADIAGDTTGFDGRIEDVGGGAAFLLCRRAAKMNRHAGNGRCQAEGSTRVKPSRWQRCARWKRSSA